MKVSEITDFWMDASSMRCSCCDVQVYAMLQATTSFQFDKRVEGGVGALYVGRYDWNRLGGREL